MQIDFRLPSLGADMDHATLAQWLKKPGDAVHRGEAFAVVETDKGLIDIESFDDAMVTELVVAPGTRMAVGTVMARLFAERAAPAATHEGAAARAPTQTPPPLAAPLAPVSRPPAPLAPGAPSAAAPVRTRLSPAARRRAHELGVQPEALAQHAAGGILHLEDIERLAAAAPTPISAVVAPDARSAMRAVIGNAMARAKREIPHYYLGYALDFGVARDWLTRYNAALPVRERLIEGLLVVKAVALAAARIEGFNGYFRDGRFERSTAIHVGTAIAMRAGGLVAPALLGADRKDLKTLMLEFSDLVTRVRTGHMRSSEFMTATITVTSLGEDGVETIFPIINPPQVAIIGTGCVRECPWVHAGSIGARPVLHLTLAADHRVTDGRTGSRFLKTVAELLAAPEKL
jgi:pyruvate dehydrogenase E2 component (dihydrolipoyllysine-residue acetyltransferase)